MTEACLGLAVALTCVLAFVSYVQLLYLESLRLLKREAPSLEYFREHLAERIGFDTERGSLAFSLIKHVLLVLIGVLYLCGLIRPEAPPWQSVLEAIVC
ncbi:MAG: hemolysin family protein, partial [Bryobacteraceae bacterium]